MNREISAKQEKLADILSKAGSIMIAYSGGVDSTLLMTLASRELDDRALGVLAISPSRPPEESKQALETAARLGLRIREVKTGEFSIDSYVSNTPERCYFCKRDLFARMSAVARDGNLAVLADGSQLDDEESIRPGSRAAKEYKVRSPLAEAGLRKTDTRALARLLGLPNWELPAAPCLATRVAFGMRLTPELLARIAEAERRVRALVPGARNLRVRHFGEEARIEIDPELLKDLEERMDSISQEVSALGYRRVVLAPKGYRSGSLAEQAGIT